MAIIFNSNRIRLLWSGAVVMKEKKTTKTASIVLRRCCQRLWKTKIWKKENQTRKRDAKRKEEDGRNDLRSYRYEKFFFINIYFFRFVSFRTFAPGTCYLSGVLGLPKVAYNQTVLNLGQWYCRVSGDTSIKKWTFSFLFLSEIYFTRAIVHIVFNYISNTYYNFKIHRNSHTSSVKTLKKFVMEMQTTETPSSSANTLAWKLARELKKICLRVFR